jgi:allantoate deiminase
MDADQGANGQRAVARCDLLGGGVFSDADDRLTRPYLGPAHRRSLDQLVVWMEEAGMTARLDAAGTLIGRYEGEQAGAPALMIGSHIDSVADAGRYDGPLGVMLGIECVAWLASRARRFPFAVEVAAFGDEEGSAFPAAMLCSRAMAGLLHQDQLPPDPAFDDALATASLSRRDFLAARRAANSLIGYLEAHIEQGPLLESEGLALGIVTAIAAQRRFATTFTGRAGHAGTNAMNLRRDALAAAAEAILAVESIASAGPPDLVATVGQLAVLPGSANVVPGRVRFSLDLRAGSDAVRDAAAGRIAAAFAAIAARRGIAAETTLLQSLPATPCDGALQGLLESAVAAIGQPVRRLVSGAGHDAMALGKITPMAMLFIRCKDGISHHPAESVLVADVELALQAMLAFVHTLAETRHG